MDHVLYNVAAEWIERGGISKKMLCQCRSDGSEGNGFSGMKRATWPQNHTFVGKKTREGEHGAFIKVPQLQCKRGIISLACRYTWKHFYVSNWIFGERGRIPNSYAKRLTKLAEGLYISTIDLSATMDSCRSCVLGSPPIERCSWNRMNYSAECGVWQQLLTSRPLVLSWFKFWIAGQWCHNVWDLNWTFAIFYTCCHPG